MAHPPSFVFGIYPGGEAGSDSGIATGPPDDPLRIQQALDRLQGEADRFIVRCYERFSDADAPSPWPLQAPQNYAQYLGPGRLLDLVVMFQSKRGDVAGFLDLVRALIGQYGPQLYSIQITEEASFVDGPECIDGPWPRVNEALVEGVKAAKAETLRLGLSEVRVGFNSAPTFGPSAAFWNLIGALGSEAFVQALDYVGLDFFPDVFHPEPNVKDAALGVMETMRRDWLPAAGIPAAVPIHIAENGWPTGPNRSEERQSEVLEAVIQTALEARERLNIERYTAFSLRDSESFDAASAENIFYHFGLMRSDYSAKPTFEMYRRLIAENS